MLPHELQRFAAMQLHELAAGTIFVVAGLTPSGQVFSRFGRLKFIEWTVEKKIAVVELLDNRFVNQNSIVFENWPERPPRNNSDVEPELHGGFPLHVFGDMEIICTPDEFNRNVRAT